MQKILVVVDMQNDFIYGALGTPEAQAVTERLKERLNNIDEDVYVLFTKDTHDETYLETQEGKKLPVPHCIADTPGWEIPDCLTAPFAYSPLVINKPTFGSIDLMETLKDMIEDTHNVQIEFCGVCTDICVVSNVMLTKVWFPEAEVIVNSNYCAGTSPSTHECALNTMKSCQVIIL